MQYINLVLVRLAAEAYAPFVVGKKLDEIFDNFAQFWIDITQEPQMRWVYYLL